VADVFGPDILLADGDLHRLIHVIGGDGGHFPRHGGGKEQGVFLGRGGGQDRVQFFLETHVEHLVGLVQNHSPDGGEIDAVAAEQVVQAAGGGDDDLAALAQGPDLRLDGGAAINGGDLDLRQMAGQGHQVAGYLHAEFPGGAENQGLGAALGRVGQLHHGNPEGGGLAGAGLGETDQVGRFFQDQGDDFGLDRGGGGEALVAKGLEDLAADAEFCECAHVSSSGELGEVLCCRPGSGKKKSPAGSGASSTALKAGLFQFQIVRIT